MPSKPMILIIPGAASPADMYKDVAKYLESNGGYVVHVHDLLSASRVPPEKPAGLPEDAEFFHGKLKELSDAGKEVVVLCHSYGGLVATDAAHGLGKDERTRNELRGGVIRIVYLTCIVGPVGESSADVCRNVAKFDFMVPANEVCNSLLLLFVRVLLVLRMSTGFAYEKLPLHGQEALYLRQVPELSAAKVFSDLPREKGLKWAERMSMQSSRSFTDKAVHDAYRHIPVTYILCTRDGILPPDFQRERIAFLKGATRGKLDTFEMAVGHCPNASAPEKTADIINRAIIGKA